jgi:hypothetical protein
MRNAAAYQLANELEEQHRVFFRNTGLLMAGGGLLALIIGVQFIRAANKPKHRASEALLGRML